MEEQSGGGKNDFNILKAFTMSASHLSATTDSIAQDLEAKNPSEAVLIHLKNPSSSP
ncbi:hypothetical protein NC653_020761 [Populus alba x Populus x berolinensis]|uniref:Uncharacterized protein n=1 Tax=Populus alba x Populus x berolinensis TaxID=444605 RepID=A0AAD6MNL2_9ROSI|nr:hypothetical protein NC653_020761 [Populus alba x Populus x berolinensis]